MNDGDGHAPRHVDAGARRSALLLALFLGLALLHTWPLVTDLGGLSRNDNADTQLNEWIVAWVAHQLPRDPIHLFDANIFYAEPRTLAFSEHLLVPSLMVAPLHWLGASPVVAYNILLILGFTLTGWTTALVVARWTGDAWAGILAGCLTAFNAHTLTRLPHVQAMHAEFLPLAVLALDGLLVRPGLRESARLAGWFVLQGLSSTYLMVFTAVACAATMLARPAEWLGHRARLALPLVAGAAVAAAFGLAVVLVPYYLASVEQGLTRSLDEVARYSAVPSDYLSTTGRIHFALWSRPFYEAGSGALFPGIVGLGLTGVAIVSGVSWRDRRARALLAIAVVGLVLSFGPAVPIYRWLYHAFPLLQGIRNAGRFGFLLLFGVAGLAGFGLAWLRATRGGQSLRQRRLATVLTAVVIVVANVEAARVPMPYSPFDGISPIYDRLAAIPDAVVVELPFPSVARVAANGPYVLASTHHWKPLVNGYSGFTPASYANRAPVLAGFPDEASIQLLRDIGVTHVVTHDRELRDAIANSPLVTSLELVAEIGDERLWALGSGLQASQEHPTDR